MQHPINRHLLTTTSHLLTNRHETLYTEHRISTPSCIHYPGASHPSSADCPVARLPLSAGLGAKQPHTLGTRCRSVLQSPGPYAPRSCYTRGCMPPSPTSHGPLHIPHSSPRGLRAPPGPPLSHGTIPHPSNIVGRCSPTYSVL